MKCSYCNQEIKIKIGTDWINDINFKVKILDVGKDEVWVYCYRNKNKCSWRIEKFFKHYRELK